MSSNYKSEKGERIDELAKSLKESKQELSEEDKEFIKSIRVVNLSDIKEPWKYRSWAQQMRDIRQRNYLRRGYRKRTI
jgi:hypothetical protein